MTQLELPFNPPFTYFAFRNLCAEHERITGYKPTRLSLTRDRFDELVSRMSPGFAWPAQRARDGWFYPVLDGVEIEVHEVNDPYFSVVVDISRAPSPRKPGHWDTGARINYVPDDRFR